MAENTFKSPGFFEQEIELTAERQEPQGVPAGIIGAAQMGPAFIPLTLGTFTDFENRFGTLTSEKFAPYAVKEWLNNRSAVTFLRVLGAGSNSTGTDFANSRGYGFVKNAGFQAVPNTAAEDMGGVQFLSATHVISAASDVGYPLYTDNDQFSSTTDDGQGVQPADQNIDMVRAMILNTSGSYFQAKNSSSAWGDTVDVVADEATGSNLFELKLVLDGHASTSDIDLSWSNDDNTTVGQYGSANGVAVPNKVFQCSFDPDSQFYVGKVLNTDPKKFQEEGHLLWLDFPVENELAPVNTGSVDQAGLNYANRSAVDSRLTDYASAQNVTTTSELFGMFNARYQAPKTTSFISQPYGVTEYDLFHFECISDGAVANNEFKVSISNLKKSVNPNYEYGTFTVEVRKFDDSDQVPQIVERYVDCSLDPESPNFIAAKIGDKKAVFNFDAPQPAERRLVVSGRYPNRSLHVRVVINENVYAKRVPASVLPFGFRGIPVLDTAGARLESVTAILPPMPYLYKATKGAVKKYGDGYIFSGQAGSKERSDSRFYWGVKETRIEDDKVTSGGIYQSNLSSLPSGIVKTYTKFMGISGNSAESGLFVADADAFNNNKFTLARVALARTDVNMNDDDYNDYDETGLDSLSSASVEMKNACYIRNGQWDVSDYQIEDPYASGFDRWTFASLVHNENANVFNKFSKYAKFTNVFVGGWDGLNILDGDIEDLNDKASSSESGGKSADLVLGGLGLVGTNDGSMSGKGLENNVINSYRQAISIMTDETAVKHNLLSIPGIRDPKITDYASQKVQEYGLAMFVMDIPTYDENQDRLFDVSGRPDVETTADYFEARAIDNSFCATYFPDVYIDDSINNRRVLVPSSVAAMGAIGYNDQKAYPWFAPAGFNRGALGFVSNVRTRLSVGDRDELYEKRINPIANFPDGGFVIFGQKTMQLQPSSLDRVNVRRMLLEVKRQVAAVANILLFEQHTPATRARFNALVNPRLGLIQAQAGIEQFKVICDESNNSQVDIDENRMNGRILLVPTRAVEFIAIDFIVDNTGVSFV